MPVSIFRRGDNEELRDVEGLCDDEWLFAPQVEALEKWLEQNGSQLAPGEYVANIAFCWRRNAASGGPALHVAAMRRMAELGMDLYFSEFPGFADEGGDSVGELK